jgi:hypothetical protein
VHGSTVRFSVYDVDTSDEDDDSLNTTVPFQVAYAVSIHKAQGLEYDSVKIVITDANEDDITHSIFYTAVTRARARLRIFWTPETQQAVLRGLQRTSSPRTSNSSRPDASSRAGRSSSIPTGTSRVPIGVLTPATEALAVAVLCPSSRTDVIRHACPCVIAHTVP